MSSSYKAIIGTTVAILIGGSVANYLRDRRERITKDEEKREKFAANRDYWISNVGEWVGYSVVSVGLFYGVKHLQGE